MRFIAWLVSATARINPAAGPMVFSHGRWYTEAGESIRFDVGERYANQSVFVAERRASDPVRPALLDCRAAARAYRP